MNIFAALFVWASITVGEAKTNYPSTTPRWQGLYQVVQRECQTLFPRACDRHFKNITIELVPDSTGDSLILLMREKSGQTDRIVFKNETFEVPPYSYTQTLQIVPQGFSSTLYRQRYGDKDVNLLSTWKFNSKSQSLVYSSNRLFEQYKLIRRCCLRHTHLQCFEKPNTCDL